jgi:hypothetical protein
VSLRPGHHQDQSGGQAFSPANSAINSGAVKCLDFILEQNSGTLNGLFVGPALEAAEAFIARLPPRFLPLADELLKAEFLDNVTMGYQKTLAMEIDNVDLLSHASFNNRPEAIDWLVGLGSDPTRRIENACEKGYPDGASPLHVACQAGSTEAALRLLQHGASMEDKDFRGWTPMSHARSKKHFVLIDAVEAFEASLEAAKAIEVIKTKARSANQ